MGDSLSPLLPAFNLLWKAAVKDNQRTIMKCQDNGHWDVPKQQPSLPEVSSPKLENDIIFSNEEETSDEANSNTRNEESVVVCTLECDHGARFVRQVIHEGAQRSEWSCAEDLFVDWLNCELTSQHAQRIDVTIYFCRVPVNTCSYGLCLWMQNLRQAGKEVSVKIKIASLGSLVSRYLSGGDSTADQRRQYAYHETRETIVALQKLANMNVVVEPMSSGDWMKLMSLLTDRESLQALDLQQTPSAQGLVKILHNTL